MSKPKNKIPQDTETKDKEPKDKNNLVGRVRKVIKKSRRKLSEEKFEKELRRTIEFLEQMQATLNNHQGGKAEKKIEKRTAAAVKKTKTDKNAAKQASAKIAGKKSKSAVSKNKSEALVVTGSAAVSQGDTQSTKK